MTISLRPRGPFSLPSPLLVALTDDGGDAVAFRAVWVPDAGEVEVDFVSDLAAAASSATPRACCLWMSTRPGSRRSARATR